MPDSFAWLLSTDPGAQVNIPNREKLRIRRRAFLIGATGALFGSSLASRSACANTQKFRSVLLRVGLEAPKEILRKLVPSKMEATGETLWLGISRNFDEGSQREFGYCHLLTKVYVNGNRGKIRGSYAPRRWIDSDKSLVWEDGHSVAARFGYETEITDGVGRQLSPDHDAKNGLPSRTTARVLDPKGDDFLRVDSEYEPLKTLDDYLYNVYSIEYFFALHRDKKGVPVATDVPSGAARVFSVTQTGGFSWRLDAANTRLTIPESTASRALKMIRDLPIKQADLVQFDWRITGDLRDEGV